MIKSKRKRVYAGLLTTIAVTTFMTGCMSSVLSQTDINTMPEESTPVTVSAPEAASRPEQTDSYIVQPALNIDRFDKMSYFDKAATFTDYLYEQNNDNVAFSMLSLDMTLALADAGADAKTKDALDSYLGKNDPVKWAEKYMGFVKKYPYKEDEHQGLVLELSNGVWIDDNYKLLDEYESNISKLGAVAKTIDVHDDTSRADAIYDINKYVNKNTHGLINEIVDCTTVTQETAAVLINTLYFKSQWQKEWDWVNGRFMVPSSNSSSIVTDCKMLLQQCDTYLENHKATGFIADYSDGIQFIGILPNKEGDFTLKELDIESLIKSKDTSKKVYAKMPAVKYDTTNKTIADVLKAMRLLLPFDPVVADFSKMCGSGQGQKFYISDIIQKTTVDINRYGTEASAATAVTMKDNSVKMEDGNVKYVTLNRPYAYVIYDSVNNENLVYGKNRKT